MGMAGYHNDFAAEMNGESMETASWAQQPVTIPLDVYIGLREQVVRLREERDAFSQKWSQALVERDKALAELQGGE